MMVFASICTTPRRHPGERGSDRKPRPGRQRFSRLQAVDRQIGDTGWEPGPIGHMRIETLDRVERVRNQHRLFGDECAFTVDPANEAAGLEIGQSRPDRRPADTQLCRPLLLGREFRTLVRTTTDFCEDHLLNLCIERSVVSTNSTRQGHGFRSGGHQRLSRA